MTPVRALADAIGREGFSERDAARFWRKVVRGTEQECWPWQGARGHYGHGRFRTPRGHVFAHRVAWILTFGNPGVLRVLHRCDNPPCCNPAHLFLGTQRDNVIDMWRKGRRVGNGKNPGRTDGH